MERVLSRLFWPRVVKRFLPTSLWGRSLLIIVLPVGLMQIADIPGAVVAPAGTLEGYRIHPGRGQTKSMEDRRARNAVYDTHNVRHPFSGLHFTDKGIDLFMQGKLDPVDAAMAKMVTSELHCETVDKCLQLFGGWGYMWEYPIARAYADARIVKIAGGSIEVMKTIISRDMFKGKLARKK